MTKLYITVPMVDTLPSESGWYNIIGDCQPEVCGRFYLDGKKFNVPTNYMNTPLYWLMEFTN